MTPSEIELKIKEIIYNQIGTPVHSIRNEDTLKSLGADSLDVVELTISYDLEFGIDLDNTPLDELSTIQQHIDAVKEKVNG